MTRPLLRALLFVPGNRPRMLARAAAAGADAVVIDLEDAVPAGEQAAARTLVRQWVPRVAAAGAAVFVRVGAASSRGLRADVRAAVAPGLTGIVLPKVEAAQDLRDLDVLLREAELARGIRPGDVATLPLIESARGLLRCQEIAAASDRVVALSLGGEDYTAELGVPREARTAALAHLRATVVTVATALGVPAIDTPWPDTRDHRGLAAEARLARSLGFRGKYVIHPDQVAPVQRAFTPARAEVAEARAVLAAAKRAAAGGRGSVGVRGRMVDAPVVARARRVIAQAEAAALREGRG